jgi:DNA-binding Lrp family transcriptional regulator
MTYQKEELTDALLEEVMPLLRLHYEEIAHFKDIPLQPDAERYKNLQAAGVLRTFTVRTDTNLVIGYAVYFVHRNLHYSGSLQAVQDVLYIDPTKRGFGMKFILWCDEQIKAEGVQVVYHHVKASHNFGPMLEKIGYELIDLIYGKRLN